MAIGTGDWMSMGGRQELQTVRITDALLNDDVLAVQIENVPVKVFGDARTIADCFRYRRKVGPAVELEDPQEVLWQRKSGIAGIAQHAERRSVATVVRLCPGALTAKLGACHWEPRQPGGRTSHSGLAPKVCLPGIDAEYLNQSDSWTGLLNSSMMHQGYLPPRLVGRSLRYREAPVQNLVCSRDVNQPNVNVVGESAHPPKGMEMQVGIRTSMAHIGLAFQTPANGDPVSIPGSFFGRMHFGTTLSDQVTYQGPLVRITLRQANDCRMRRIGFEATPNWKRIADDAQGVQLLGQLALDHANIHLGATSGRP